jgi:hypothetical protein
LTEREASKSPIVKPATTHKKKRKKKKKKQKTSEERSNLPGLLTGR